MRAIAQDPGRRLPSARQLASALRPLAAATEPERHAHEQPNLATEWEAPTPTEATAIFRPSPAPSTTTVSVARSTARTLETPLGARPASPRPDAPRALAPQISAATPPDRSAFDRVSRELALARQGRGVVPGDLPNVDRLERAAIVEMCHGHWDVGIRHLTQALSDVEATAIDAPFVAAKIARLDQRLRARPGSLATMTTLLDEIMQSFERHDFNAANEALNRALRDRGPG